MTTTDLGRGGDMRLSGATPFRRLLEAEAANALQQRHGVVLALLIAMGVLLAVWLPHWPETIYRFFTLVFHLGGWSDIVIFNNFASIVFLLYWLGVIDTLRVYVQPYEEQYLDLLLAKPITRQAYLLARLVPLLLVLLAIGAVTAATHAVAMIAVGLPLNIPAYMGSVAILIAFVLCLVSMVNLLLVAVRDSFTALVTAFVPFFVTLVPTVVFLYRPDAYEAAPDLPNLLVFPANMLWHPEFVIRWSPVIVPTLLLATLAVVMLAGYRLARRDVP